MTRYFRERKGMIARATSQKSYHRIVEDLANSVQMAVVAAAPEENALALAGPGAGKTRLVAHRCAYLLRVCRVPARSILILCFNRNAAITLRRRLWDLVGLEAKGVMIQTYHGLAMRLTGVSFADRADIGQDESTDFDRVIRDATCLLCEKAEVPGLEGDELRERLLAGYSHILVDEYQDIDCEQYDWSPRSSAGRGGILRPSSRYLPLGMMIRIFMPFAGQTWSSFDVSRKTIGHSRTTLWRITVRAAISSLPPIA